MQNFQHFVCTCGIMGAIICLIWLRLLAGSLHIASFHKTPNKNILVCTDNDFLRNPPVYPCQAIFISFCSNENPYQQRVQRRARDPRRMENWIKRHQRNKGIILANFSFINFYLHHTCFRATAWSRHFSSLERSLSTRTGASLRPLRHVGEEEEEWVEGEEAASPQPSPLLTIRCLCWRELAPPIKTSTTSD